MAYNTHMSPIIRKLTKVYSYSQLIPIMRLVTVLSTALLGHAVVAFPHPALEVGRSAPGHVNARRDTWVPADGTETAPASQPGGGSYPGSDDVYQSKAGTPNTASGSGDVYPSKPGAANTTSGSSTASWLDDPKGSNPSLKSGLGGSSKADPLEESGSSGKSNGPNPSSASAGGASSLSEADSGSDTADDSMAAEPNVSGAIGPSGKGSQLRMNPTKASTANTDYPVVASGGANKPETSAGLKDVAQKLSMFLTRTKQELETKLQELEEWNTKLTQAIGQPASSGSDSSFGGSSDSSSTGSSGAVSGGSPSAQANNVQQYSVLQILFGTIFGGGGNSSGASGKDRNSPSPKAN